MSLTIPTFESGIIWGSTSEPQQSIYTQSETQKYTLGTLLVLPDGRKFRYAKNGAVALSKAYMTQSPAGVANCLQEAQGTSGTAVEIGDQEIVVDVTSASGITDNLYSEGWLVVNKSTGIGDIYKILACNLLTATTAKVLLETPIRTAFAAATELSLVKNKWCGVLVSTVTATQTPTGVPLVDVTIGYYAWLQTCGPAPVYVDAGDTIVIGNNVGTPGTAGAAGTCGVQTAGTLPIWGQVMYVAAAADVGLIDLKLD